MKLKYSIITIVLLHSFILNAQKVTLHKASEIITKNFTNEKIHEYIVSLNKNQFFLASTSTKGIDVKASVYTQDGIKLAEVDDNGFNGEFIKINSIDGRTYTIKIEPYDINDSIGEYSLTVEAIEEIGFTKIDRVRQQLKFWANRVSDPISGLGIVIVKDGKTMFSEAYGKANLEYNIPLSENSIFDIASLAKQFTGLAVAKLIEENKLSLDEDVTKYIPELPDFGFQIKVSDLVHHTSGLRDIGELFDLGAYGNRLTSEKVLEIVSNQKGLNFEPGTSHSYSNTGYVLLAVIVERITNQTIGEWSATNIFEPLGMKNSFVNNNPELIIKDRAVAYTYTNGEAKFRQDNGMALIGSSAVYTSIADMAKWLKFLQSDKKKDIRTLKNMTTKGKLSNGDQIEYGFGLAIAEYSGLKYIRHSGGTPAGFNTLVCHFPDQKLSFAILSNTGSINPIDIIGREIISIFLEDNFEKKEEVKPKQPLDLVSVKMLEGHYQFNEETTVHFYLENDKFLLNANKDIHELEAVNKTNYRLHALDSNIEFFFNEENIAYKAIITSGGNIISDMPKVTMSDVVSVKPEIKKVSPLITSRFIGKYYSEELLMSIDIAELNKELCLKTSKHGVVPIRHEKENYFTGFGDLEFIVQEDKNIQGFNLTRGNRMRDVYFKKVFF